MNPAWLDLPVRAAVPALLRALDARGTAVLAAPPGTGKTTLVPLALAGLVDALPGPLRRVLVAEPRRLAVRAAARRMSWLLDEAPGGRVGHTIRGERRVGPGTVVEVVTTGVLLQRLQRDPELPGVDTVVLDECHERHLDADTALAFLLDVRATLRPELRLVCASATSDTAAWAALLGGQDGPAPVVEAHGVSYPVETVWAPPPRPVRPPQGLRTDPALLDHVAATVRRALRERDGDVLCFLPGAGELARVAGLLGGLGGHSGHGDGGDGGPVEVLQLHGRAPAEVQDAALAAGRGGRRVVLATAVAESSLTVPGVRVVVDCGLAREPRTDHARGLSSLVTVRASLATGRQRAGRAGREAPGTVYRCWSEAEEAMAQRLPTPEIALADLTAFALQAACWGDPRAHGLALLDAPPTGAMAAARETLTALGAVDAAGRVTARGRRITATALHPRLARALLDGAPLVGPTRAAELVAVLSEEPPRALGDDLSAVWRMVRRSRDPYATRWHEETRRLARQLSPERGVGRADSDPPRRAAGAVVPDPAQGDRPGADRPGADGGGADRPGTDRPGADGGGADRPGADRAGVDGGGADRRGADRPGTDRPGADGRGADGRGADRPGLGRTAAAAAGSLGLADGAAAGLVAALAFPERVARARRPVTDRATAGADPRAGAEFLMASGTAAATAPGSPLAAAPWLAVAVADRPAGSASARIQLAAVLDEETALQAGAALLAEREEVRWAVPPGARRGDVAARRVRALGAIELSAKPLTAPDPALLRAALLEGLAREGVGELLTWSERAASLRLRLAFLHRVLGAPWPDVEDAALLAAADDWLEPELSRARRRADLARLDTASALARLLPWASGAAGRLDELAPERITVPSGSRIRVDYSGDRPVLAAKLQELFGWAAAPALAGGRVPLTVHLLSPAGRPAAVTADLASFWGDGYRAVRADLRGRYPRHPWPEDPSAAAPTRRLNPRR
ncbi:ATP-dependent helicase C-terminal domain-containing protein [Streptacidiphilus cavernicola]|uniref:ATP-dependent helicase C-terminal domain-containing protein n=1 Tax=Streptacidiphilus cavernicola TaxID=3342716 RepID=A0ABV6VPR4_9ACTN